MAMSNAQAQHLQSLTTALMGLADAADAEELDDALRIDTPASITLEQASDTARRVLEGESYDLAAEAVAAEWAASSGEAIPEPVSEADIVAPSG